MVKAGRLPEPGPPSEIAVRLRCVLQLEALVDLDLYPPGSDVSEQLSGELTLFGGIGDVIGKRRPRHARAGSPRPSGCSSGPSGSTTATQPRTRG